MFLGKELKAKDRWATIEDYTTMDCPKFIRLKKDPAHVITAFDMLAKVNLYWEEVPEHIATLATWYHEHDRPDFDNTYDAVSGLKVELGKNEDTSRRQYLVYVPGERYLSLGTEAHANFRDHRWATKQDWMDLGNVPLVRHKDATWKVFTTTGNMSEDFELVPHDIVGKTAWLHSIEYQTKDDYLTVAGIELGTWNEVAGEFDDDDTKDINPKDAVGVRKVPTSVVPTRVEMELGLAMLEGAIEYGRHNYRVSGIRASVYYDAARRHLAAWWEGEDFDTKSGLHHLVKCMACCAVARDGILQGNWVDDRPPRGKPGWMEELNEKAADLLDRLGKPKEAWTQKRTVRRHDTACATNDVPAGPCDCSLIDRLGKPTPDMTLKEITDVLREVELGIEKAEDGMEEHPIIRTTHPMTRDKIAELMAKPVHKSDCSIHHPPTTAPGICDCGAIVPE